MNRNLRRASAFFVINLAILFAPFSASAQEISSVTVSSSTGTPLYLYIPSINLFSIVENVGIDSKGRMDVPSGKTNNVGWYKYGPTPGNVGTAVLDAHNTAAFKNLHALPIGGEVYVYTSKGEWLKFVVNEAQTYEAKNTDPSVLFAQASFPKLNLITCAGTLLGGGEATHRLIVSAQLI